MKKESYALRMTVHGQKGLTLVEVLVAVTILTIGLLGVALMQVMSITGNTFSKEMEVATGLSQDMMERLKGMDYNDPALRGGVNHPTQADVANGLAPAPVGDANNLIDERGQWGANAGLRIYTRTWNIVDNSPAPGMKSITVTVSWIDRDRQAIGLPNPDVEIQGVRVQ